MKSMNAEKQSQLKIASRVWIKSNSNIVSTLVFVCIQGLSVHVHVSLNQARITFYRRSYTSKNEFMLLYVVASLVDVEVLVDIEF